MTVAITTERMQAIMVDADLGRPADGYTEEELRFRERAERAIAEARARGERLEFTSELP